MSIVHKLTRAEHKWEEKSPALTKLMRVTPALIAAHLCLYISPHSII